MRVDGTIAAPATPPGRGAIAVVRISGPDAGGILQRLTGRALPRPRRMERATLRRPEGPHQGEFIDDALVVSFPGPRSYTGEDVVELHLHGGALVVREAMDAVLACGARAAEPGEFTLRAFLSGRMDLVQAEAVAGIIDATSPAALDQAGRIVTGRSGAFLGDIQDSLRGLLVRMEADLDFPEDAPELPGAEVAAALAEGGARLGSLVGSFDAAAALRQGHRVVLAGPPNVGKSALFNALVGHPRALVTGEPGTTRDYLEEAVLLDRTPVVLVDTAGLRDAQSQAEREGVERSLGQMARADLVLRVADRADPDASPVDGPRAGELLILNKCDLPPAAPWSSDLAALDGVVSVSAKGGEGLDSLIRAVNVRLAGLAPQEASEDLRLVSLRQRDGVARAAALLQGVAAQAGELPGEIVAGELRAALDQLAAVTGRQYNEHVLDEIFEGFCIGK